MSEAGFCLCTIRADRRRSAAHRWCALLLLHRVHARHAHEGGPALSGRGARSADNLCPSGVMVALTRSAPAQPGSVTSTERHGTKRNARDGTGRDTTRRKGRQGTTPRHSVRSTKNPAPRYARTARSTAAKRPSATSPARQHHDGGTPHATPRQQNGSGKPRHARAADEGGRELLCMRGIGWVLRWSAASGYRLPALGLPRAIRARLSPLAHPGPRCACTVCRVRKAGGFSLIRCRMLVRASSAVPT